MSKKLLGVHEVPVGAEIRIKQDSATDESGYKFVLANSDGKLMMDEVTGGAIRAADLGDGIILNEHISGSAAIVSSKIAELNNFDTDDLSEGSSNLYYTDARWDAKMAGADTDDLSEGSSNLYYTDVRARAAVSATDAGGDGSFAYNSSTGVFTYTGPSASEVRAHFSAGTGVSISNGSISIGQAVAVSDDVEFNQVTADLVGDVTGTVSSIANHDTDSLAEGSSNLYYTDARWDAKMAAADTDDLSEGSSNQYFTQDRARGSVSATDAGGDGSFAYNSSTGVFTYTGPSASEVRAHFSAGTGVTVSSGQISIGQAVGTSDSVTFDDINASGDLVVTGSLTVNGTTTTIDTTNLEVEDSLIGLSSGLTGAAANDAGLIIERGSTGDNAALIWDESADRFMMGTTQATSSDTGDISVTRGSLEANIVGDVTGDLTGNAQTASALVNAMEIEFATGDVTGSVTFDGSTDIPNIALTVENDAIEPEMLHADVAGVGLDLTDAEGLHVDLSELDGGSNIDPANDQLIFIDDSDNSITKRDSASDFIGNIAGDGIQKDANSKLALDINGLASSMSSADAVDADLLPIYDADAAAIKKVSFQNLRDSMFGDVSGDATIAAGGALTVANEAIEKDMLDADIIADHTNLGAAPDDEDELLLSEVGVGQAAVLAQGDTLVLGNAGQNALLVVGDYLVFTGSGGGPEAGVVFEVTSIAADVLGIQRDTSHPSSAWSGNFSFTPSAVAVQDASGNSVSRPVVIGDFSSHFQSYSFSSGTTTIYHASTWEAVQAFTVTYTVGVVSESSVAVTYVSDTAPAGLSFWQFVWPATGSGPYAVNSASRNGSVVSGLENSFQYYADNSSTSFSAASGVDLDGSPAYVLKALTVAKLREAMASGSLLGGDGIDVTPGAGTNEIAVDIHESQLGASGLTVSTDGLKLIDGTAAGQMIGWNGTQWGLAHPCKFVQFQADFAGTAAGYEQGDCELKISPQISSTDVVTQPSANGEIRVDLTLLFGIPYAQMAPNIMGQVFAYNGSSTQELAGTNMRIVQDSVNSKLYAFFDLDGTSSSATQDIRIGFTHCAADIVAP